MCEPERKIQATGLMFSQNPHQAGDSGKVGVTADGVNLDSQETVMVKIDQNLLLKLHSHICICVYVCVCM